MLTNEWLFFNNSTANELLSKQLGITTTGREGTLLYITSEWMLQNDFTAIVLEDDILLSDFFNLSVLLKADWIGVIDFHWNFWDCFILFAERVLICVLIMKIALLSFLVWETSLIIVSWGWIFPVYIILVP